MVRFFRSLGNKPIKDNINPQIVRKLTEIRLSEYPIMPINRDIVDTDLLDIKYLVQTLGKNILKANHLVSDGVEKYLEIQADFEKMTDIFFGNEKNKYAIVFYAAQLLQYYTIICDDNFLERQNCKNFITFLDTNRQKFGDASKNTFIVEYQLIKIYNELCELTDSITGQISPIGNIEEKATLLDVLLKNLESIVNEFKLNAPDNIFSHYLNFVTNYTTAKALELRYRILDSTASLFSPEEKLELSNIQQLYLDQAKGALEEMETLTSEHEECRFSHLKGMEFSFGQEVLSKLPVHNFDEVKTHVSCLVIR